MHRSHHRRRRFTPGDAEANIGWLSHDALIYLEDSPATLTLDVYGHFFEDDLDGLSNALGDLRVASPADISRTSVKDADVIATGK